VSSGGENGYSFVRGASGANRVAAYSHSAIGGKERKGRSVGNGMNLDLNCCSIVLSASYLFV
jgi:hypothetical protein